MKFENEYRGRALFCQGRIRPACGKIVKENMTPDKPKVLKKMLYREYDHPLVYDIMSNES